MDLRPFRAILQASGTNYEDSLSWVLSAKAPTAAPEVQPAWFRQASGPRPWDETILCDNLPHGLPISEPR
jgi:hypothetical protein